MNLDVAKLILKELIDDDDSSSSEESCDPEESSDDETLALSLWSRVKRRRVGVVDSQSAFVARYSNEEFVKHFRLSKATFRRLVALYEGNSACKTLTPDRRLLMFLWFAGHEACTYRQISGRFDVSLSSVHEVIFQVSSFISTLTSLYVTWLDEDRRKKCAEYFMLHKGFPGVIGCIGCMRVPVDGPRRRSESMRRLSVSVQLVCDESGRFTDVFVAPTGLVDDAEVYLASPLRTCLHRIVGQDEYLVGNSAYPCESCLLTPYRDDGQLTDAERRFNRRLDGCQAYIEGACAVLRRRFRQLYHCRLRGAPINLCRFISACVVIHNMSDVNDLQYLEPGRDAEGPIVDAIVRGNPMETHGDNLRDEICRKMCT